MKHCRTILISVLALLLAGPWAGGIDRTPRNIIQNSTTFEQMKATLVQDRKWVPYPAYADRSGWDKLTGSYKESLISGGEKYLDFEWKVVKAMDYIAFETTGDRKVMEDPLGANNRAIAALFAAELAEGKGRFIPQIVNGVFHICEMTSWSLSAHLATLSFSRRSLPEKGDNTLELTQGDMSQMLSWIYYFLHNEFDRIQPELSKRLKDEITYRELDSFLERSDFWWLGLEDDKNLLNNWTPWCNFNALMSFMLMEDNPDRLANAVWKTIRSVDEYLNCVKADGGIDEGPSYWAHASGKLYDYLNALSWITGGKVSLFGNKQVKDMGEYIARSYVGDGWVVNFADASAHGGGSADLIYRYGKATGSGLMTGFAEMLLKRGSYTPSPSLEFTRFLESLAYADEFTHAADSFNPSAYTWYPDTQFHFMSGEKGVFAAAKGGYNDESHNHNDIGTFNLYYDNLPVIIDVGVGTYTRQTFSNERYTIWTMQSNYHNVPVINGVPQRYGAEYKASQVISTPTGFSADIAGAYPQEAQVKSWIRSYKLAGNVLKVSDKFNLGATTSANVINFMTWGDVDISTPGVVMVSVQGRNMQLKYDRNVFDATIEAIPLDDSRLSSVWGDQVYRISLTARKLTKSGTYSYSITKL